MKKEQTIFWADKFEFFISSTAFQEQKDIALIVTGNRDSP